MEVTKVLFRTRYVRSAVARRRLSAPAFRADGSLIAYKNVNVVYIGTMNVCHYDDAKLAINAGKNVLLEKVSSSNPRLLTKD